MSLELKNLYINKNNTEIIHGVDLKINPGEVHAIMGPNGAGKSTLANTIMGHPHYTVTQGDILLEGEKIQDWEVHDRAEAGIFLSMQNPPSIPGISVANFLRHAKNALTEKDHKPVAFLKELKNEMSKLNMDHEFAKRSLHEGFSGGEKKKLEILQLNILEPRYAILDETDSGLDVDALKTVSDGINKYKNENRGIVVITHYNRILEYLHPDFVHILVDGKIVKSGGPELAKEIEDQGYDKYLNA